LTRNCAAVKSEAMPDANPPPIPARGRKRRFVPILMWTLVALGCLAVVLRLTGMLRPFSIPTSAMTPTIAAGDHVLMEGYSYKFHDPRRGDLAVFKTAGISRLPQDTIYVKRIVGLPGNKLRIADGTVYIDDVPTTFLSSTGRILPGCDFLDSSNSVIEVPAKNYFVMGDNSDNSSDSRCWGFVPRENIIGRINFRYWPPHRIGNVR
jgi:signal peptidase I